MQGKTIQASPGETRKVTNEWAAQAESRGATVAASSWEATGNVALGTEALSSTAATVTVTVTGCGRITNTVTLSNGETLNLWRDIAA